MDLDARTPVTTTVALAHDYLTQRGGAERVVLAMAEAFPGAPLHTSLYDAPRTYDEFRALDVRTGPLDAVPLLRRQHRLALPLLASSISRMRIDADVVLCSSSGWAHGMQTDGCKIVYCHSPAKWLYAPDRYFSGTWPLSRRVLSPMQPRLEQWDRRAAASADRYVVNSTMVQRWVQDVYGIEADVLHPPHTVDVHAPSTPVPGLEPGFVLLVSRLMAYKNVGAVVQAAGLLPGERLVVAGSGPQDAVLRAMAGPNVTFLGRVPDEQLRWLYANCRGTVSAAQEDFGLTPLESAAFGKPVAVLRWGGFLDTVVEGRTGTFFDEATPADVAQALRHMLGTSWDQDCLKAHAATFSVERFQTGLQRLVLQGSRTP